MHSSFFAKGAWSSDDAAADVEVTSDLRINLAFLKYALKKTLYLVLSSLLIK